MAQVGFVLYLIASAIFTLLTGSFDPFEASALGVAAIFLVLVWQCWRGRPWAFLASSVIGLALLLAIPTTLTETEKPLIIWEASLGATLLALVAIESFLAYAGMRKAPKSA